MFGHGTMPQEIEVAEVFPRANLVASEIPLRPRQFLTDALASLSAPSASIMATCSAIDAMLKEKGIGRTSDEGKQQSLHARIEAAVSKQILTADMAKWAHRVRLDANDQRHADESAAIPDSTQAKAIFELATGLAEVLFVLPAKAAQTT